MNQNDVQDNNVCYEGSPMLVVGIIFSTIFFFGLLALALICEG